MINFVAKFLVLIHAILSLAGMTYGMVVFLQARDYGWADPSRVVTQRSPEGVEQDSVSYASEYDKSVAALEAAKKARDLTYAQVQPAIDSINRAEPYLYQNHLFYLAQMDRLRNAQGNIDVRRLSKWGQDFDPKDKGLGAPQFEPAPVPNITKSYQSYEKDLKDENAKIDQVEAEIRAIVNDTKQIVADLTGTDETNKYVQPGLYRLIELEYKAQTQYKKEIDDIKPNWSQAVEQARLLLERRSGLEATLDRLKVPPPAKKKP